MASPAADHPPLIDLSQAITVLRHTPSALDAWLRPLPSAWLDTNEGPGTWSPRQVVMHLAWGEIDDWLPRVTTIVTHGATEPFKPFDRELGFERYDGWSMAALLDEFATRRAESLDGLQRLALTNEDLLRHGRHPEFGLVTLGQLLATWVTHDLAHITQIGRILTKQTGVASGPWRAYFSLLRPDVDVAPTGSTSPTI